MNQSTLPTCLDAEQISQRIGVSIPVVLATLADLHIGPRYYSSGVGMWTEADAEAVVKHLQEGITGPSGDPSA
jgi:hypothetical protein